MSTVGKVRRPVLLIGGIGLASIAAFVAFCAVVTAVVLGAFLATGTLQQTSQGWVFRAGGIAATDTQLSSANFDPKVYPLLQG